MGCPGGSVVENLPVNAGDMGSIPGSGRSSGEGNGNPLQYSWLGNPTDRRAWWVTVHGVAKELGSLVAKHHHPSLYGHLGSLIGFLFPLFHYHPQVMSDYPGLPSARIL